MYSFNSEVSQRSRQLAEYFSQQPSRVEVLRAIYNAGGISRAEISRVTGFTKVTVSEVVNHLESFGLIDQSEPQRSTSPGKPPILIQIRRDELRTIAVDASSRDMLVVGSIDLYGRVLSHSVIEVSSTSQDAFLAGLEGAIVQEIASSDLMVVGVGIGIAGVVDNVGTVVDAAALGIRNLPLQQHLSDRLGLEVRVGNDANVATKADSLFGGGKSSHLLLRVGRGVGAGLILNGETVLGANFAAGELGHVVVRPGGVKCNCGKRGCLEAEIGLLLDSEPVNQAEIGDLLGQVVAPIASVLNLPEIVVSCTFESSDTLVEAISERISETTLLETSESLTVRHSNLDKDIVLLGAAALALSAVLGVA